MFACSYDRVTRVLETLCQTKKSLAVLPHTRTHKTHNNKADCSIKSKCREKHGTAVGGVFNGNFWEIFVEWKVYGKRGDIMECDSCIANLFRFLKIQFKYFIFLRTRACVWVLNTAIATTHTHAHSQPLDTWNFRIEFRSLVAWFKFSGFFRVCFIFKLTLLELSVTVRIKYREWIIFLDLACHSTSFVYFSYCTNYVAVCCCSSLSIFFLVCVSFTFIAALVTHSTDLTTTSFLLSFDSIHFLISIS